VDVLSASPEGFWGSVGWTLLAAALHDPVWLALAALALAGATASLRGHASRRALAATSLAFIVIGVALLAFGWPWGFSRWLGFFRVRTRYLLLSSFGLSLLVAQGFDALRSRLSFRSGGTLLLASLTASLVFARLGAVAPGSDAVLAIARDRALYRRLGEIVREQGGGPLLEVPYVSSPMAHSAPEAMIGQLEHGAPLIVGFTAYRPDHHALLLGLIAGLPAASAVDDLVDLTHLRWILVRPPDEWPDAAVRQRFLDGLGRYPARGPSWTIGPWVLQRLDRVPSHPTWFDWLAAGPRPGHSVLGTPLEPIPERDAIAAISARVGPGKVFSRSFVGVAVAAANRGAATWPAWVAGGSSEQGLVRWTARWRRVDGSRAEWGPPTTVRLRRDVPPNETLAQSIVLGTPAEPGSYELRIAVEQKEGAGFSAPGNEVAILHLDVAPLR
jgi:hypothetical protein